MDILKEAQAHFHTAAYEFAARPQAPSKQECEAFLQEWHQASNVFADVNMRLLPFGEDERSRLHFQGLVAYCAAIVTAKMRAGR